MEAIRVPTFVKHWTLVGLNCYLLLSLNFVGVFAQEHPPRIVQQGQPNYSRHHQDFRASPTEHASRSSHRREQQHYLPAPRPAEKSDTIDLSQIPTVNNGGLHFKPAEASIDRLDAYGDYDYIDNRPKHIQQYHRPLRHNHHNQWQPPPQQLQRPLRRVEYQHPNHHYPNPPSYHHPLQSPSPYQTPFSPGPKPALSNNGGGLSGLNPFNILRKKDPSNLAHPQEDSLFDPLLKLVGLKEDDSLFNSAFEGTSSSQLKYHDPLEYDYGDYLEGFQNHVKPQRPKTISERVAKWFTGFKIPSSKKSKASGIKQKLERLEGQQGNQHGLDYSQYDTDDDQNLVFYNHHQQQQQQTSVDGLYDFQDVLHAIRNNETSADVFKKVLSAAAALSERSDSNPVFMMWTVPTTILALLGLVYFAGAIAIIGYKYVLQGNGNAANLIPVAAILVAPLVLGFIIVGSRSAMNGQLQVNRLMRGDVKGSMRQDFDGVDFVMDAIFGSSALLGIGWLVSVAV